MVGGVCINTGTIPSKTFREAVLYLTGYQQRGVYGPGYAVKENITMQDLLMRCNHVIKREIQIIRERQSADGGFGYYDFGHSRSTPTGASFIRSRRHRPARFGDSLEYSSSGSCRMRRSFGGRSLSASAGLTRASGMLRTWSFLLGPVSTEHGSRASPFPQWLGFEFIPNRLVAESGI